ncbi:MAG TPA: ABC transporter ATP-binding protein [Gammaproteobacteria bacterium]|nr:ABC transporter ATP-binding protein [Gammaproteobacteria bacterium]
MQHSRTMPYALELTGVGKRFGTTQAVCNLNLRIEQGEFYALLGPNGAGKTTTLRMIAGLLKPSEGEICILGESVLGAPERAKRPLAYLPDEPALYGRLRPLEYLEFVAGLWGMPAEVASARGEELLKWLGLGEHLHKYVDGFSRGMQQKLVLAGALIHEPQLLILDEPLTGLDAAAARQIKDLLRERVNAGMTVVLTTHILDVAERLAERIGIIQHGRLIAEGTLESLRQQATSGSGTLEDVFLAITAEPAT